MPPIIPFIPAIIGGIGAIAGGIGASKGKTSTQTGVQTADQSSISALIAESLKSFLGMGPNVNGADRNAARTQINQTYDDIRPRLESQLTQRGFGNSGKVGSSFKSLETSRASAIQQSDATQRQEAMQRFMQALGLGENFSKPFSFSQTQPGTPWQSSLGSGLSDLSGLLYGSSLSKGGGNPFGGGNPAFGVGQGTSGSNPFGYPCHIAVALYGRNDWRVTLVRNWLFRKAQHLFAWRVLLLLYELLGLPVATLVRRSSLLRLSFRWLFDRAVFTAVKV